MKGVSQQVPLDVTYLGQWDTPWWWEGKNLGTIRCAGWEARTRIDRRDFGISWDDDTAGGGIVVSSDIAVVLDVEAMRDEEPRAHRRARLLPPACRARAMTGARCGLATPTVRWRMRPRGEPRTIAGPPMSP
jgi:YceI-like domain